MSININKEGFFETLSKEILDGLKRVKDFLGLDSWKEDYTEKRTVELSKDHRIFIEHWLDEKRRNIPLDTMTSGKYYRLSESGEETLRQIINKLYDKAPKLIFTEYELGFIIFWLERTREGLEGDFSNTEFIILLEVYDLLISEIQESKMKKVLNKKIESLKES